jgi:defect-in-organelle-trafficking protein DotC
MRPFPVIKPFSFLPVLLLSAGAFLYAPHAAHAQQAATLAQQQAMMQKMAEAMTMSVQQAAGVPPGNIQGNLNDGSLNDGSLGGIPGANNLNGSPFSSGGAGSVFGPQYYQPKQKVMTQDELDELLKDSDSPQAKADRLADKHKHQRDLEKNLAADAGDEALPPAPQDLEDLQGLGLGKTAKALNDVDDDNIIKAEGLSAIDLRRDAQKEAALSFGARGGLAKSNFEIMEKLQGFETTLDQVFDFRALLIKAPSGMLIEPPIVRESVDSLIVTQNGNEAAVADRIYDINKQSKIVTAPRDWRQYLIQSWVSSVPKPPRLLWPKNAKERADWNRWVAAGWRAGAAQASEMFESNLARLVAEYSGMVRYRTLLTQGMISQPYALHEDRGVTGTKTVMRVGDRALRITGPSQFLMTGSDLWKPADR